MFRFLFHRLAVGAALLLLPLATGSVNAAEQPTRELHLFLLVGQSNMAGRGEIDPADNAPLEGVWVWGAEDRWMPAVEPYHWDKSMAGAGLAKSFAAAYRAAHPDVDVGLIPAACGGSALHDWAVGAYFEQTRSHPWFDATRRAKLAMTDGTLRGILWHQGESDSHPGLAENYEAGLRELLQRFRAALAAPTVPIVIGQTGRFTPDALSEPQQQVDAANRSIAAADAHVVWVSAKGLTAKPDGIHFETAALRELGRRYYAAWATLP
ncbi:sialate O-acetylesterase [Actomonas aquatica]|uniref:Sialate O-acetylesterase n=1 Tax=Actomonas aquatica TaxID=2866162 RepID=A0ABZ1CFL1_9BACT|nr:sialate O-acetylesterase [Opitutus sp. WL0086]WRQ89070.1 sialate O-acetylesterase [Opitutus sp. WL0086]